MNYHGINNDKDFENKNITNAEITEEINKTKTFVNNHPYATKYILQPEITLEHYCGNTCNISKS